VFSKFIVYRVKLLVYSVISCRILLQEIQKRKRFVRFHRNHTVQGFKNYILNNDNSLTKTSIVVIEVCAALRSFRNSIITDDTSQSYVHQTAPPHQKLQRFLDYTTHNQIISHGRTISIYLQIHIESVFD